ncbi:MAG: hypothetical protein Q4B45_03245 [Coriobacteriia bacterium]|nr:hypothetical protein [Coriobacteriia bacterium]
MPAILTHDFFGKSVEDDVSQLLGFTTEDERRAFLLGNQGPDPLFFLCIDPLMGKWEPLGNVMHESRPARLVFAMREAAERLEGIDRMVARAYVAGFVCHYLLDRSVHPLVYHWQEGLTSAGVEGLGPESASVVHAEIERDIDEAVLWGTEHKTIREYRPYAEVLRASSRVLAAVDKVYFYVALWAYGRAIDPRTFSTAVHEFRLVQRAFYSPGGKKAAVMALIERRVSAHGHSRVAAMAHRVRAEAVSDFDNRWHGPWTNPFTGDASTESFADLFESARACVLPALAEVFSCGFDEAASEELTGNLNFEGAPASPDGPVGWKA